MDATTLDPIALVRTAVTSSDALAVIAARPATDGFIERQLAEFDARFELVKGFSAADPTARQRYEIEERNQYQDVLNETAQQAAIQLRDAATALAAAEVAAQELPSEASIATPAAKLQARVVDALETDLADRWLGEGQRSASALLARYSASSDAADRSFVRHIEGLHRTGELAARLKASTSDGDVVAMQKLTEAIAARRLARIPPPLVDARASLTAASRKYATWGAVVKERPAARTRSAPPRS